MDAVVWAMIQAGCATPPDELDDLLCPECGAEPDALAIFYEQEHTRAIATYDIVQRMFILGEQEHPGEVWHEQLLCEVCGVARPIPDGWRVIW